MSYDLNANNYSEDELFILIGIEEHIDRTKEKIKENIQINLTKALNDNNLEIQEFLKNVEEMLLTYIDSNDNEEITDNINIDYDTQRIMTSNVIIDSQYKETINSNNSNTTSFTLDLTAPLNKTINMTLYSVEIPYSWYTFDSTYGTNSFTIDGIQYDINSGNYSPSDLITELNRVLTADISATTFLTVNSGKITIQNNSSENMTITFFDELYNTTGLENSKINSNLGWLMGFRNSSYIIDSSGGKITGEAIVDTWGTRYLILTIDDFNNNYFNQGMIGIATRDNSLEPPTYDKAFNYTTSGTNGALQLQQVTTMKTLTNAQINTFNYILNDRNNKSVLKTVSPTTSNVFAKIPITKPLQWNVDNLSFPFIEFSGPIQKNERNYFGPVDITRMKVSLLDDKGRQLNLNGLDWSFSLNVKHLYQ